MNPRAFRKSDDEIGLVILLLFSPLLAWDLFLTAVDISRLSAWEITRQPRCTSPPVWSVVVSEGSRGWRATDGSQTQTESKKISQTRVTFASKIKLCIISGILLGEILVLVEFGFMCVLNLHRLFYFNLASCMFYFLCHFRIWCPDPKVTYGVIDSVTPFIFSKLITMDN